ncbi:hypothetical protein [Algibacter lectus]|uniref:Lipoprotein n=1 Tax=Algibacter lectus TaxID=221126 RepID=A0A4R8M6L9_9FLAO|nr:hypothetical protein [Algibacter lectus]MWW25748.1 hypothetical protein [Algibacter lectus]TDY61029.1 hypothetical protein DFQ06_3040 [Algibacter lectus]
MKKLITISFLFLFFILLTSCGCADYFTEKRTFLKSSFCFDKKIIKENINKSYLIRELKKSIEDDINLITASNEQKAPIPKSELANKLNTLLNTNYDNDILKQWGNLYLVKNYFSRESSKFSLNSEILQKEFEKAEEFVYRKMIRYKYITEIKEPIIITDEIKFVNNKNSYQELIIDISNFKKQDLVYQIVNKTKNGKIKIENDTILKFKVNKGYIGNDDFKIKICSQNFLCTSKKINLIISSSEE